MYNINIISDWDLKIFTSQT